MTSQVLTNSVIVAENDVQMRDLIRSILLRVRQQVFPVADGAEALMLARQFRARLVLLDISMPRLNGLQACSAIHQLPGYADVPIIMLTSHDHERFRAAAKRVGATDFITKPFRPNSLLTQLADYLDYPETTKITGVPLSIRPEATLVDL
jgi:CheY-like chemotaxis protein